MQPRRHRIRFKILFRYPAAHVIQILYQLRHGRLREADAGTPVFDLEILPRSSGSISIHTLLRVTEHAAFIKRRIPYFSTSSTTSSPSRSRTMHCISASSVSRFS